MKNIKFAAFIMATAFALNSCSSDDSSSSIDDVKPAIDTSISGAFPTSCATVRRGSVIPFKALFSDNVALGAYSINIHNNFDHHSHDTEVDSCPFDAIKTPVNPWTQTLTFTIPVNSKEFTAQQEITVPADIDTGDYHFMIQLTDAQGWATMRGISFKIIE
ncbi:DUF4625 domain-containing protein [Flavobacterium sp. Sd200]|uniref:DUF4625 domain-containing protein n=1 Tax=Flavobacterium sp. Sd200 TaxID=2692211 RepID=UPI00136D1715|nr:DUF4625 domain-containing protein [Flavobacterium sp. Sd200]MXN93241.1 DUF4625 domain-containing protein [Flavobacterium sp. Sd200]